MDELITVVVPAYNVENYIGDCINSVKAQIYANWELIVVDDGSTDNTNKKAYEAAGGDARIQIVRQTNSGVSAARNTGLDLAKGKSVIFLDGDDLWTPECLSQLEQMRMKTGSKVTYCGYNRYYSDKLQSRYHYAYSTGDVLLAILRGKLRLHIGCMLIDREFLLNHNLRFTEGALIAQDVEFVIKLAAICPFQPVRGNYMLYRVRPNSAVTSAWNWEKHIHGLQGLKRASEFTLIMRKSDQNYHKICFLLKRRLIESYIGLIWKAIKAGHREDVLKIIEDLDHSNIMQNFSMDLLGFKYRIKWFIIQKKFKIQITKQKTLMSNF